MKRTDIPCFERRFTVSSRVSASASVRTAVGSSSTRSCKLSLSSSRAISMNCMKPTGRPATFSISSIPRSSFSREALASFRIFWMSRVFILSPRNLLQMLGMVGSRFNLMFSMTVKPGSSMNSWCTIPIPRAMASSGEEEGAGLPLKRILPLNPPVLWITGMPKRIFIRVDLPAPFSPTMAWTSPGSTAILMPLRTLFPK